MSQIHHEQDDSKGRYWTRIEGHLAQMTYSRSDKAVITIDHTVVPDALRGKGVGGQLVQRAVLDARAAGIRIVPLCPFAKAQIQRHPDWQDVL